MKSGKTFGRILGGEERSQGVEFILPDARGPEMGAREREGKDSQGRRRLYKDRMTGGQKCPIKESKKVFK